MKNPLRIENQGTLEEKVSALINVVNALTDQMYQGRVKQAQNDIQTNTTDIEEVTVRVDSTEVVNDITFVTLAEAGQIDDVTAGEHASCFSAWAFPVEYKTGQMREHLGKLYRCLSDHTSQEDWTPDAAVSLWVAISDPEEEFPAWSQPVGAHDAYSTGDKVSHNEKRWVSDVDGNVWEPGVYGWAEYVEV